jgi:trans-2,3-dihydro-3-hydroxyanthranilate isomerase
MPSESANVDIELLRVFPDGPDGGSRCPVVLDADHLDTQQMLDTARHLGLETVFVLTPTDPGSDIRLRYFVPNHEMDMCVHATVAALSVLADRGEVSAGEIGVQTQLGRITARVDANGEISVDQFRPRIVPITEVPSVELARALGCDMAAVRTVDTPVSVSVSRPKLLVEVDNTTTLQTVRPTPELVADLCRGTGTTGLYAFAVPEADLREAWARQFPLNSGYPEDPATGLAAAALGVLLALREPGEGMYSYLIRQGHAMGRPSRITVGTGRRNSEILDVTVIGTAEREGELCRSGAVSASSSSRPRNPC